MAAVKVYFSIDLCDNDGDSFSDGIFLHFGDAVAVKIADCADDLDDFFDNITRIKNEIKEA